MKILFLNQCFYPDVVATAQHLTDLAVELSRAGHEVTVIASNRGYDDPSLMFPEKESWQGITIHRVSVPGLGKRAKWRRAVDFVGFFLFCFFRMLHVSRQDVVVGMTSPPLIAALASLFVRLKGGKLIVWIMDLNPDEAIAAGVIQSGSIVAMILDYISRSSMQRAERLIVLDRFMKERIAAKGVLRDKIYVVPPWSHEDAVTFDRSGRERFRSERGLENKFVVMYSGNHSPCHPLDTLLGAALQLRSDDNVSFCFVGGGSEFVKVKEFKKTHALENIICLPYQPLDKVSASLSAGDMHVVVMGDDFVGIKHPCKIYNVLALGAPFLFIGPENCHVRDLCVGGGLNHLASSAKHGDVARVIDCIQQASINRVRTREVPHICSGFSKSNMIPKAISIMQGA